MSDEVKNQAGTERHRPPRRGCPRPEGFIDLLRSIRRFDREITCIIRSGTNCCEITGCVGEIVCDEYLVLISPNDACVRNYIRIDCICAIIQED
ncbi:hypothetical protein [Halonatronum saccharophilum]|uniref:hypothetical protein n=1 Tax=Halonatronum saccharophilum TaxID=150060 RepID=UPI0004840018|nr:hypothetical protein [Halonatronum saccharophilum]